MDAIGWALLPVFEPGTKYVASGAYHLPLFAGEVDSEILDRLTDQSRAGVNDLLRELTDNKTLQLSHSSVLVSN